jgi:hypothetical protein
MATLINLDQSIVNESETQPMSRHRAEPLPDYFLNDQQSSSSSSHLSGNPPKPAGVDDFPMLRDRQAQINPRDTNLFPGPVHKTPVYPVMYSEKIANRTFHTKKIWS